MSLCFFPFFFFPPPHVSLSGDQMTGIQQSGDQMTGIQQSVWGPDDWYSAVSLGTR